MLALAVRMVIPFSPSFAGMQIQVEFAGNPVFVSPAPVVPLPEPMAGAMVQNTEPMVISRLAVLTAIWAAGALLFLLYHGVGYQICKRRYLRWSRPVQDETTKHCLEQAKSQVGVHACCALYSRKNAYGPLTIGFFKPYLLLPQAAYPPQDLAYIFKHELVHIKRRDVWYKLILLIANAAHWFNPLAYLMVRKAREDLELLCDDMVVQGLTYQQRKAYSKVILEAAYNQCRPATQLSTMFKGSVKTLKE